MLPTITIHGWRMCIICFNTRPISAVHFSALLFHWFVAMVTYIDVSINQIVINNANRRSPRKHNSQSVLYAWENVKQIYWPLVLAGTPWTGSIHFQINPLIWARPQPRDSLHSGNYATATRTINSLYCVFMTRFLHRPDDLRWTGCNFL